tara:strand:+ start:983 stop:1873 length:891 start_codon:yes stop_codon:yes gene_type:complete
LDVAILTEKRYLDPKEKNWYTDNIVTEENLIKDELKKLNINAQRVAWDKNGSLINCKCVLFRTTWNYFDKIDSFLSFLKKINSKAILINPYDQIIWNLNKKYLVELSKNGINIPPTEIIKRGDGSVSLTDICCRNRWGDVVIKPCVSAAAWNTHYIPQKETSNFEDVFSRLVRTQDMIVQEFQKTIKTFGEISLVMIGGGYTHAVIKNAKKGDFRVQDDFGGSVKKHAATKEQIKFAVNVLGALDFNPLYARVDLILDNHNNLALSELELIEPELWFRLNSGSALRLATEIKRAYF